MALAFLGLPPSERAGSERAGCRVRRAFTGPEVFSFYGIKNTLIEKFGRDSFGLENGRLHLFLIQTESRAEVILVEREGVDQCTIWSGTCTADLHEEIQRALLSNRGALCVGEQIKCLILKKFGDKLTEAGPVPFPLAPPATIRHPLKKYQETDFLRITLVSL
jgi:hypothetical protein